MKVSIPSSVTKELLKLDPSSQNRIIEKLKFYSLQKDPLWFAKSIGKGCHRFRIGDYRIIFYIENNIIYVVDIDRRDKVYK